MTRSILYVSGFLALGLAAGCASSTGPTSAPQVNYQQGHSYVYTAQTLDATTGQPTGTPDTITSTVVSSGSASYQGMSGVTEFQNVHTHPATGTDTDMTYIAQSNGSYWHYNYGVESLNSNATVVNTANAGKPINAGWVLQAKLGANAGDTWVAADTTLVLALGTATLTDNVTEANDTSIMVNGSAVTAKHAVHQVKLNAGIMTATEQIDTYVSVEDGIVIDIDHPTVLAGNPTPGLEKRLLGTK